MTQFGRALSELNIEILCANTSQAKGRVERAHHTLQDRLVKELRLAGISTIEAANAFLPAFVQTYNGRFAKPAASERDLHRPIAGINDLDDILCWREQRSVSRQLVVNYNRMKFMLRPNATLAALAGKLVDICDFPDGRLEIRWKGLPLPYSVFDHLQRVSHAAIVENKRLGEVLAWIKQQQDQRPHHRSGLAGPRRSNQKAGLMKDRVDRLAQATKSPTRPARLGRRRCDVEVSPQRRPRLPQKPPSDILTLQSKGHLNLVATQGISKMLGDEKPKQYRARDHGDGDHIDQILRGYRYR
jgi:hypothetical protein